MSMREPTEGEIRRVVIFPQRFYGNRLRRRPAAPTDRFWSKAGLSRFINLRSPNIHPASFFSLFPNRPRRLSQALRGDANLLRIERGESQAQGIFRVIKG